MSGLRVVLCEKPSVARDIARFLHASAKRDGYFEGAGWAVTWAFGHLLELKDPHEYRPEWKAWRVETLPMIPDAFELKPRGDKGSRAQLSVIKKLFKDAAEIICATDAGREGELIFRYILSFAGATRKPVRRLWVSSLTAEALAAGFKKLLPASDFDPLYRAAKCRSEADWIVGLNATRYFTVLHGSGRQLWSLGRVQTPVLAMIVGRDLEIENFKPEDYWEVHTRFRQARLKHVRGRIDKLIEAQALVQKITPLPLTVHDVGEREDRALPPLLYDLTDLQKDLNRRFGLSADRTLKAAQSLYEKKCLTYPRTDSKHLPKDVAVTVPALLEKLRPMRPAEIARLDLAKLTFGPRLVDDLKVTDHHAILPTGVSPPSGLSADEQTVFEAVLIRLIAAFYPAARRRVVTVKANAGEEEFSASGSFVIDPGWEALYPRAPKAKGKAAKDANDDEEIGDDNQAEALARLKVGDSGPHEPELKTLKTKAPLPLTEGTLLQMMETAGKLVTEDELKKALKERGLGTPATRASIIETLLGRGYVDRKKKTIVSTEAGRRLIGLVDDRRLKSPELTGEWEMQLKRMEKGEADPVKFLQDVVQYTREIVGRGDGSQGLGPCPLCQAPVIEGQRGYGCSKWKDGCTFVLWKDLGGGPLPATAASRLLRTGASKEPLFVNRDGRPAYVTLTMDKSGKVEQTEAAPMPAAEKDGDGLGVCPKCRGAIVDSPKAFGCANWRQGCKFTIWKTIAKKKISQKVAKELLTRGRTEVLNGFKSKAGAEFSARLVLKDFEVKFEFAERAPTAPSP